MPLLYNRQRKFSKHPLLIAIFIDTLNIILLQQAASHKYANTAPSGREAVITRDLLLQRLLEFSRLFNLLNKNALIFVNLLNSGYTTYRRMNRPYRFAIHLGMKRL